MNDHSNKSHTVGTEHSLAAGRMRRMAQSAKTTAERLDAIAKLKEIAESEPTLANETLCWVGRLYRAGGDLSSSIDAFRASQLETNFPGRPHWALREYANALVEGRRYEEAESFLRKVIADDTSGVPEPALVAALGRTVLAQGGAAADAVAVLHNAILAEPNDRLLVEGWFDRVRESVGSAEAISALKNLQLESTKPLLGVLLALEERLGVDKVRESFASILLSLSLESPFAECQRVWDAMLDGREPDSQDCAAVERGQRSAQIFFHFLFPPSRQLPLFRGDAKTEKGLAELGIHAQQMREFAKQFLTVSNAQWSEILAVSKIEGEAARSAYFEAEQECSFLDNVVRSGSVRMMDPLSGEIVEAHDSVIAFGRTAYCFRGKEFFLLICGRPWSGALGLYIPRLQISLPFLKSATGLLGNAMPNVLEVLLRRRLRKSGAIKSAIPASGRREICLSVGGTENFAHQVWNFYSAVERLIVTGLIDRVSRVIFSGTEFFGPLGELFPEVAAKLDRPRKGNVIDPYDGATDGLVVPAGGYFVPRSLTHRIIDTMRRRPRIVEGAQEPRDFDLSGKQPVVWLGLRLRDKAWVDQENGTGEVIRLISAKFPSAIFLLDGFSYPVGEDYISGTWSDVIAELRAMGDRVARASAVTNTIVNMVGNTMRESVLWAQEADVYLAPYGTTQHKIGWFTQAPGLVYVGPNFSPQVVARSPACAAVDYARAPEFIFASAASKGERRGLNRVRERFENVNLDAESIASHLCVLLERRLAETTRAMPLVSQMTRALG
jgi:hypothetical protein